MNSNCPICHICNPVKVDVFESSIIFDKYNKINIDISRFLKDFKEIPLMQCSKTHTRFFFPISLAGDSFFYETLNNVIGSEHYYLQDKWEYKIAKDIITNHKLSSILDIGCGNGIFLSDLPDNILKEGIEFNSEAIKSLLKKKIKYSQLSIEEFANNEDNNNRFDVITAFQVIEHIPDVYDFLTAAIKCVKKKGLIILGTPNNNPYLYGYDKYHTLNLPPHHISLWNKKSLKKLSSIFPIELIEVEIEPFNKENFLQYLYHSIINKLGLKFGERIFYKLIEPIKSVLFAFSFTKRGKNRNIIAVFKKI